MGSRPVNWGESADIWLRHRLTSGLAVNRILLEAAETNNDSVRWIEDKTKPYFVRESKLPETVTLVD